jgi:hypothetical protein
MLLQTDVRGRPEALAFKGQYTVLAGNSVLLWIRAITSRTAESWNDPIQNAAAQLAEVQTGRTRRRWAVLLPTDSALRCKESVRECFAQVPAFWRWR